LALLLLKLLTLACCCWNCDIVSHTVSVTSHYKVSWV